MPARAGIFDDDEARRAILDLRKQLEQSNEQSRSRQAEQMAQMSDQLGQLKRSLLELNSQIELQRGDNARLRGQIETLTRDVAELQRKQTDVLQGVDDRLRKVEPQKVTIDDREITVDPEEKRAFDDALAGFRRGEFDRASSGFGTLLRRYPATGYRASALFWLGNAQYGQRAYKDAIGSFRNLVVAAPDSPHAPEALLAIANCQAELKDSKAARRTIDELMRTYPKSEAAQAGRDRLASLK
ncbi:MAG: tol-pal system protein YbgF [Pseudomonadota bacterium]|nr:tol-pal system protein YbgF [Pseudomonadota bacterium]